MRAAKHRARRSFAVAKGVLLLPAVLLRRQFVRNNVAREDNMAETARPFGQGDGI